MVPELGPPPQTVGIELGILAAGVLVVIKALEVMSGRSLWSLPWPGVFFVLPVALWLVAELIHNRVRAAFRTAAPELFSADGRPRIPEGYDRDRN